MMVGGFSESKYLQARIRQEFGKVVTNITIPIHPMIAIVKGAVRFGLQEEMVVNRVLKRTECTLSHFNQKFSKFNSLFIGTDIARPSQLNDPASQKLPNGLT